MSGPAKEGARQCASFKAIGTAPSINKTPVGDKTPPLPYATFQDLSNSVAVVPNVMLNGKPAYVLEQSIQPTCQGDEPGTEKGVKSGTVSGYVKPKNASSTVTMMGMLSVRFGDPCVMNGGNNPGIYTTEEPAAANPAKSAAETSDPDMELETPEESSSAGEWLDQTANDIGEWWEQTKYEMGEAVDHPWEGTKGGVKGIINIAPETGEMLIKTLIKQQANKFEVAGILLNLLGGTESAQGANAVSQMINRASDSVNAPKFEMSNDAQAGGNNIVTGVTSVTGLVGIVKSIPKLFSKFGSKASKEADEVVEEAASPGDGVVVKPAKAEPDSDATVQGGVNAPNKVSPTTDFVGDVGRLGGELYSPKKLSQLEGYLSRRGIELRVGDEHVPLGKAGGFNADKGFLILRDNPTNYEVWHELSHFMQYQKLGRDAYLDLPRTKDFNAPEQFVFDMLENSPKRWNSLNFDEQQHAIRYIENIGGFR